MKKHTTLKSKFNAAFSLVELLVVIAVIAVIAAIAIPNIAGTRDAALAAQASYDTNQFIQMSNQLAALGQPGATLENLTSATGITASVGDEIITFKLQ
jgi:prepilin-type N-terminal cleavage/methylation domain-containing protein